MSSTEDNFVVRPAVPNDASAMKRINEQCLPENYPYRFWFETLLDTPSLSFVCYSKTAKAVVGYILVSVASETHTRILSLATLPEFRRQGIAKLLIMNALAASVILHKKSACRLEVRVGNAGAIGLYERIGFTKDERIPEYYADKEDGWSMVWTTQKRAG